MKKDYQRKLLCRSILIRQERPYQQRHRSEHDDANPYGISNDFIITSKSSQCVDGSLAQTFGRQRRDRSQPPVASTRYSATMGRFFVVAACKVLPSQPPRDRELGVRRRRGSRHGFGRCRIMDGQSRCCIVNRIGPFDFRTR